MYGVLFSEESLFLWPVLSQDLSPMEHICVDHSQHISHRLQMHTLRELKKALQLEWSAILQSTIQRLMTLAADGGHKRYSLLILSPTVCHDDQVK